jgi:hypothetical protein
LASEVSSTHESTIPFIKSSFLKTTALVGERQYPRCMVSKILSPKKSYAEEQGFEMKKGSIGPSRAVMVVRPRVKKLRYYDWESKYLKNEISISTPFTIPTQTIEHGVAELANPSVGNLSYP